MRPLILLLLLSPQVTLADFNVEAGIGNLSSEWTSETILIQERFDKWLVGIGYISEQWVTPDGDKYWWGLAGLEAPPIFVDRNLFIHGQRLLKWKKFEIGVGAAFFQNCNRAMGTNFTVSASASYHFNKHLSLNARHFSNAGSGTPNMGQDAVTLGWTF